MEGRLTLVNFPEIRSKVSQLAMGLPVITGQTGNTYMFVQMDASLRLYKADTEKMYTIVLDTNSDIRSRISALSINASETIGAAAYMDGSLQFFEIKVPKKGDKIEPSWFKGLPKAMKGTIEMIHFVGDFDLVAFDPDELYLHMFTITDGIFDVFSK